MKLIDGIIEILARNNFGNNEGPGPRLSLRYLSSYGVRIEGGFLGATFNVNDGFIVWNVDNRVSTENVKVKDLHAIDKELTELFKRTYRLED